MEQFLDKQNITLKEAMSVLGVSELALRSNFGQTQKTLKKKEIDLTKKGKYPNTKYSIIYSSYYYIKEIKGYEKEFLGGTLEENLTGKVFGRLTVLYRTKKPKTRKSNCGYWLCQCSCEPNKYIVVDTASLNSGKTSSCGCYKRDRNSEVHLDNLTGKIFGRWKVLKRGKDYITPNTEKHVVMWTCQCNCENKTIRDVAASSLRNGDSKSCGCYNKEKILERSLKQLDDLTGQKFGHLTVLRRGETTQTKKTMWVCQCDCKKKTIFEVQASNLKSGHTISCGCLTESKGVTKIKELLQNNKILYNTEKIFLDCKDKSYLPFDFYIERPHLNYTRTIVIIEFDGIQHFDKTNNYYKDLTHKHDLIKNKYCFDNNITLIRIPYSYYDNLCLEDLLPETSKFILTPENESQYYKDNGYV